jgi:predicted hydrocarbon binding protein
VKDEPAGLAAVMRALAAEENGIVKHVNVQQRGKVAGWVVTAFLDMSKSINGPDELEAFLSRLGCVEDLVISHHKPVLYQTYLFPLMNGDERVLILSVNRMLGVRKQLEKILTTAGVSVIFYNLGLENGRILHQHFFEGPRAEQIEDSQKADLLRDHCTATGFGVFDFKELDLKGRQGIVKLYGSFESEGITKDRSACFMLRGILTGFLQGLWGTDKVKVAELKCMAIGSQNCEFAVGIN